MKNLREENRSPGRPSLNSEPHDYEAGAPPSRPQRSTVTTVVKYKPACVGVSANKHSTIYYETDECQRLHNANHSTAAMVGWLVGLFLLLPLGA
jgi:hypothetical protein